jgi:hypothetical protein
MALSARRSLLAIPQCPCLRRRAALFCHSEGGGLIHHESDEESVHGGPAIWMMAGTPGVDGTHPDPIGARLSREGRR